MEKKEETLHLTIIKNSIALLKSIPDNSISLIIADPPYNIDIDHWDQYDNYLDWAREWIDEVYRVMKDNGNFVLFGGFQFQNKTGGDLLDLVQYIRKDTNFMLVNVIIWYYKNGITARRFFANRHEEIIWFAKTKKYIFNLDDVRIKYDKETLELYSRDKRLNIDNLKKGKNPTNVWEISRLNSNSKERVGHLTQKPEEIIRRLIRSMSNRNDIILDIFAGSGVSTKVCIEENRHSISCDIDPKFNEYINTQLSKLKNRSDYKIFSDISDLDKLLSK